MTEQISYTHIKEHRNGSRLWIEGAKLLTAGFARGQRYNRHINGQKIDLMLHPEGDYVVSGRERNGVQIPIIDLSLGKFSRELPPGTRVRAIFQNGQINITIHHEEDAKTRREDRLKQNVERGELLEASACTGGGISTMAVHQALHDSGIKNSAVAWVVDCELKYLQSAYEHVYAINDNTVFFEAKLEELETQFLTEVDVFSFSLPCSGFSKSGTSKHGLSSEEHDGGTSVFGIMNIIRAANPAIILSENVPEAKDSSIYTLIKQELKRRGYSLVEAVLNGEDTGSFENRTRYWFMAYSQGLPSDVFESAFELIPQRTYQHLYELMDAEVPESMWADNQYLKDKQVRDAAAGKGFATRQLLKGHETKIGTIGRHYNKRRSTEPFIVNDSGQERLLTLAEHARCKSIPESLVARCNATTGHEILGQSIDYLQAYLPIKKVMSQLVSWLIPRKEIAA